MAQALINSTQLTATGITPGSYTSANVTVDVAGRITAIANGSGGGGTPGGATTQVQFNNAGAFGGSANLTVNTSTGQLTAAAGVILSGASSPLSLGGSTGTSGQVLTSAGAGNTPTWTTPTAAFTWNTQVANYTLALTDANNGVAINSASAIGVTVPADGTVNFPVGTSVLVAADNTGTVTIIADSGVTISVRSPLTLVLSGRYAVATLIKRAANSWYLTGDLV